ncbi:MAG: hypothetical protein ACJAT5_000925 [Lentimonas sp.]|jgi:hypothetical protein
MKPQLQNWGFVVSKAKLSKRSQNLPTAKNSPYTQNGEKSYVRLRNIKYSLLPVKPDPGKQLSCPSFYLMRDVVKPALLAAPNHVA